MKIKGMKQYRVTFDFWIPEHHKPEQFLLDMIGKIQVYDIENGREEYYHTIATEGIKSLREVQ